MEVKGVEASQKKYPHQDSLDKKIFGREKKEVGFQKGGGIRDREKSF